MAYDFLRKIPRIGELWTQEQQQALADGINLNKMVVREKIDRSPSKIEEKELSLEWRIENARVE